MTISTVKEIRTLWHDATPFELRLGLDLRLSVDKHGAEDGSVREPSDRGGDLAVLVNSLMLRRYNEIKPGDMFFAKTHGNSNEIKVEELYVMNNEHMNVSCFGTFQNAESRRPRYPGQAEELVWLVSSPEARELLKAQLQELVNRFARFMPLWVANPMMTLSEAGMALQDVPLIEAGKAWTEEYLPRELESQAEKAAALGAVPAASSPSP